jgi:hypothetical protein
VEARRGAAEEHRERRVTYRLGGFMNSQAIRKTLTVIQGGGNAVPKWRDFPQTVRARSPFDRNITVTYRLAQHDLHKASTFERKQIIFDCWSCIFGRLPPVPNIQKFQQVVGLREMSSLANAHACFRGFKRPVGDDPRGWDMVAYVTKPSWTFEFEPDLACVAKPFPVPQGFVFLICVRLDNMSQRRYKNNNQAPVEGVVTHWEFVECDPVNANLPRDFKERFTKQQW